MTVAIPPSSVVAVLGPFDPTSQPMDPVHLRIRRFRSCDEEAVRAVTGATIRVIQAHPGLRGPSVGAVVVPGHDGVVGTALVRLAAVSAAAADWTRLPGDVLVRTIPVVEAKRRGPRVPMAESASLCTTLSKVPKGVQTILLIDDVIASGGTLEACRRALHRDGWQGAIAALVVGRADLGARA